MLDRLQELKDEIHSIAHCHHVELAYVFGSCARKEEKLENGVNLLIDFNQTVTLFDQIDIQAEVLALLGRKVGMVSKRGPAPIY